MGVKETILEKARKFAEKGALDKAIAEYRSAVDVDPKDVSIRLRIGDLYVKLGNQEEAIKEYMEVAKVHALKGFHLKAIAVYKQILKLDALSLDVHNKLAELYTKQRLIVDAISEYSYLVSTFEKKGATTQVMDLLKKMIEIDPENVGIRLKMAEHYQKLGFAKDALVEYTGIFQKLVAQGKSDKAEKIYLTLQSHAYPKEPQILTGLMELFKKKGDSAHFLKFARLLSKSYKDSGDTDNAKAVAEEILKVKPDDNESLSLLSVFHVPPHKPAAEPSLSKHEVLKAMNMNGEEAPLIDIAELNIKTTTAEAKEAPKAEMEAPLIELNAEEFAPEEASLEPGAEEAPLIDISFPEAKPEEAPAPQEAGKPAEEGIEVSLDGFEPHEEAHEDAVIEPHAAIEPESETLLEAEHIAEFEVEVEPPALAGAKAAETTEAHTEGGIPAEGGMPVEGADETMGGEGLGGDEFVDLAAEIGLSDLGLEDMIEKMAGSFNAGGSKEAADEFKTGMQNQLGREDMETHYNLGIAYMEMELFSEALKEFKVALKDAHLEFDCYTRLGLCAMAASNPEEAIAYYLKGMKLKGRSDEERKGIMYELAVAYEAASKTDDAATTYRAIGKIDPNYREVKAKLKEYGKTAKQPSGNGKEGPPLSDDMLEVELM